MPNADFRIKEVVSQEKKENPIVNKSFAFACDVVDLNEQLILLNHFQIAKQVIRSGTSIGATVKEAVRGAGKPDFIIKMSIALKDAYETSYWFDIIDKKLVSIDIKLRNNLEEIIKLLVAIINSSKK